MHSPNLPIGTSSSFSISARLAHLKDARAWLDRILLQANYPLVERQNVVTAISELATNVIKHGSPSADTVNVEFRVNGEGEYIIIRDNGGEFKDYATFAQAGLEDLNNSDLLESGMGLAITRQLVELMGGHVGMRSQPGEGSTFWAVMPLPAAQPGR